MKSLWQSQRPQGERGGDWPRLHTYQLRVGCVHHGKCQTGLYSVMEQLDWRALYTDTDGISYVHKRGEWNPDFLATSWGGLKDEYAGDVTKKKKKKKKKKKLSWDSVVCCFSYGCVLILSFLSRSTMHSPVAKSVKWADQMTKHNVHVSIVSPTLREKNHWLGLWMHWNSQTLQHSWYLV